MCRLFPLNTAQYDPTLESRFISIISQRLPNLKDEPNFFDTFKYSPLPLSDPTVFNHNRPAFPSAPLTTNNNWYPQTHGNSFQNHYPYDPTATHQVQVSQMTSHHNLNLTQNQVQYYPTVPVGLPPYQHIYDNAFRSPSNHSLLDRYNGSVDPTLVHRGDTQEVPVKAHATIATDTSTSIEQSNNGIAPCDSPLVYDDQSLLGDFAFADGFDNADDDVLSPSQGEGLGL